MVDRLGGGVRGEVLLGHVGHVFAAVDEHVVPGAVLRRPAARDLAVPLLGQLEVRVHVDDHAAVAEQLVLDELSDAEPACLHSRSAAHPRNVAWVISTVGWITC